MEFDHFRLYEIPLNWAKKRPFLNIVSYVVLKIDKLVTFNVGAKPRRGVVSPWRVCISPTKYLVSFGITRLAKCPQLDEQWLRRWRRFNPATRLGQEIVAGCHKFVVIHLAAFILIT